MWALGVLGWFAFQLLPLCWGMMLAVQGLACWPGDRSPERGGDVQDHPLVRALGAAGEPLSRQLPWGEKA